MGVEITESTGRMFRMISHRHRPLAKISTFPPNQFPIELLAIIKGKLKMFYFDGKDPFSCPNIFPLIASVYSGERMPRDGMIICIDESASCSNSTQDFKYLVRQNPTAYNRIK